MRKLVSYFSNTSHIETRRKTRYQHILAANRLINMHRNNDFSQKNLLDRAKEEDCCKRKSLYSSCFRKKIIHKSNVYFHLLSLAFSEVRARFNHFVKLNN